LRSELDTSGLGKSQMAGFCEHGIEFPDSLRKGISLSTALLSAS